MYFFPSVMLLELYLSLCYRVITTVTTPFINPWKYVLLSLALCPCPLPLPSALALYPCPLPLPSTLALCPCPLPLPYFYYPLINPWKYTLLSLALLIIFTYLQECPPGLRMEVESKKGYFLRVCVWKFLKRAASWTNT